MRRQQEEELAAFCKDLVSTLQLVSRFYGDSSHTRALLPPDVVSGTAALFHTGLPRYLAAAREFTPTTLSLLESQLSACWSRELGLAPQEAAHALATLLPAAQRGLARLAERSPGVRVAAAA